MDFLTSKKAYLYGNQRLVIYQYLDSRCLFMKVALLSKYERQLIRDTHLIGHKHVIIKIDINKRYLKLPLSFMLVFADKFNILKSYNYGKFDD